MVKNTGQNVVCIRRAPWNGEDVKPMTAAPRFGEILTIRSIHKLGDATYFRFEEFRSYNIFSTGEQSSTENQFHSENFRPLDLVETGVDLDAETTV